MADCGGTELLRGGVVVESHITAASITDSRVTSSVLQGCQLLTLASIDTESAQVIANALSQLPESALAALAKALLSVSQGALQGESPATTTEAALPSTIAGGRDELLGRPDTWLTYQGYVIPSYKAGQN